MDVTGQEMQTDETRQETPGSGSTPEILPEHMRQATRDSRLTAVETGFLWNAYMSESLVHHIFVYFLKHMQDPVIKPVLVNLVDATKDFLNLTKSVFVREGIPVPRGITSEDINLNAPRLFSDAFFVPLLKSMTRVSLQFFSLAYSESTREDIRQFFRDGVDRLVMHTQQAAELMRAKGTPAPPPYLPLPEQVDFVKRKSFLGSLFKDEHRPLTSAEIARVFADAQENALGKALLLGYIQVAGSREIKQFLMRGKSLATKYYTDFTKILFNEDITVPGSYDGEVADSTESPFSDRFILYHSNFMAALGLQDYGMALSISLRYDLAAMYARMMVETGSYANEGAKLMIKKGWMEQPPMAPDREALAWSRSSRKNLRH